MQEKGGAQLGAMESFAYLGRGFPSRPKGVMRQWTLVGKSLKPKKSLS